MDKEESIAPNKLAQAWQRFEREALCDAAPELRALAKERFLAGQRSMLELAEIELAHIKDPTRAKRFLSDLREALELVLHEEGRR